MIEVSVVKGVELLNWPLLVELDTKKPDINQVS